MTTDAETRTKRTRSRRGRRRATAAADTQPHQIPRGRSGRPRDACVREGCRRRGNSEYGTCSMACLLVLRMLDEAERLCRAGLAGPDYWAEVVALGDALTAVYDAEHEAKRAAGTPPNWADIKRGTTSTTTTLG